MAQTKAPAPPPRTRRSSPAPAAHLTPAERAAMGKAVRTAAPRTGQGMFDPPSDRPDPVDLLEQQAAARVPELVPVRYGRMLVSHARSGGRIAIAAYLGNGDVFDQAIARFAAAYADQNERDHAALATAAASGRITVESGL